MLMLYGRDYNFLTEDEKRALARAEEFFRNRKGKMGDMTPKTLIQYHNMKPDASYYFESLFPNNFLSIKSLNNKESLRKIGIEFETLINSSPLERQILTFINSNRYYNLIASVFHSGYTFGHHDAYLFKEFEFPCTYKADYLLIGKNSHGYHFVFIELESPFGSITTKSGDFGSTIRKGILQVENWDKWIEENFAALSLIFEKTKSNHAELPREFRKLNKSRIHYVVICGRRSDFNEITYEEKRRLQRAKNIQLLHYDNLIDCFNQFQSSNNY